MKTRVNSSKKLVLSGIVLLCVLHASHKLAHEVSLRVAVKSVFT
jgi:hypothetical protein